MLSIIILVITGVMLVITVIVLVIVTMTNRRQQKVIKELEKKSIYDSLTKVFNRGYLDVELLRIIKEIKRSFRDARSRKAKSLSFIMIDLDKFKEINDTWGHCIGDAFLLSISNALRAIINRPGDTIARYGGEEFFVILTETNLPSAQIIAEKMKNVAKNVTVKTKDGLKSITISLGVITVTDFGGWKNKPAEEIVVAIINKADSLLYKAKGNGRNQFVSAEITL